MTLPTPIIIVNLKTYEAGSDAQGETIARAISAGCTGYAAGAAIACQAADLFRLSEDTKLPLLAQHADADEYGAHTGAVLIETLKCNGAVGTLLNHSEKRVPFEQIKATVAKCKRMGFISIVCAQDNKEATRFAKLSPDYIAVEPPELIGGKISVSTAKPGLIAAAVKAVAGKSKLIVGAGVHTTEDVRIALKLGAAGVLVASGVVQARDPKKAMKELMEGTN